MSKFFVLSRTISLLSSSRVFVLLLRRTQEHQHNNEETPKVTACRLALPIVRSLLHFTFNEHFSHSPLYATFACVSRAMLFNLSEHFAHLFDYCGGNSLCELRSTRSEQHLVTTALKPTPVLTADGTLGLFCMHLRGVFQNFAIVMMRGGSWSVYTTHVVVVQVLRRQDLWFSAVQLTQVNFTWCASTSCGVMVGVYIEGSADVDVSIRLSVKSELSCR
jgi:hypothetical protein